MSDPDVQDAIELLRDRGYTVIEPGAESAREIRAQALQDAGEIVFTGHNRKTPIQLAVQLKQMSDRVREGKKR